jgi:uncharacterized protein (DUF433 family)
MTDVITEHIEIVQGAGGPKIRIAGTPIRVMDVAIWSERMGMTPDEIVDNFPTLTLADVHAALAYYWDHRDEIERAIEEDRAAIAEYRRRLGPGPLAEALRRQAAQPASSRNSPT